MKYTVKFHGREFGAIGVTGSYTLVLDFDHIPTGDEIVMRVYDTHEHITGGFHVTPEGQQSPAFHVSLDGKITNN